MKMIMISYNVLQKKLQFLWNIKNILPQNKPYCYTCGFYTFGFYNVWLHNVDITTIRFVSLQSVSLNVFTSIYISTLLVCLLVCINKMSKQLNRSDPIFFMTTNIAPWKVYGHFFNAPIYIKNPQKLENDLRAALRS